jgi:NitT/TauT family transport system substrate-binding protein
MPHGVLVDGDEMGRLMADHSWSNPELHRRITKAGGKISPETIRRMRAGKRATVTTIGMVAEVLGVRPVALHKEKDPAALATVSEIDRTSSRPFGQSSSGENELLVRLKWRDQAQFAGLYAASDKGFFESQNLKITLQDDPPTRELKPLDSLNSEVSDFAIAGALEVVKARASGMKVKAIATIFPKSPACWMYHASSDFSGPENLHGKVIGVDLSSESVYLEYRCWLNNAKRLPFVVSTKLANYERLSHKDRREELGNRILEVRADEELFEKRNSPAVKDIDLMPGYVFNEFEQFRLEFGKTVECFDSSLFDLRVVGDVLVTTDDMIKKRRLLVQRFVNAFADGWDWALSPDNLTEMAKMVSDRAHGNEIKALQREMVGQLPKFAVPGGALFGQIDPSAWRRMQEYLSSAKMIPGRLDKSEFYDSSFIEAYHAARQQLQPFEAASEKSA